MATREEYVQAAYGWASPKTPFRHQARVKGAGGGVDCIGLVIGAGVEVGNEAAIRALQNLTSYPHQPDGRSMQATCQDYMTERSYNRLLPLRDQLVIGDIILFWIEHEQFPRHVSIVSRFDGPFCYMLHSYSQAKGVVESRIDEYWQHRIVAFYDLNLGE